MVIVIERIMTIVLAVVHTVMTVTYLVVSGMFNYMNFA
jgi:hypothetical protein